MNQATIEPEQILESLAGRIVHMGLSVPAVFFLEMHKPLAGVAGAAYQLIHHLILCIFGRSRAEALLDIMQSRENVEKLIRLVERKADRAS